MSGQLTGLSSMATRHILSDLARDYKSQTGVRVEIRSMGGVEAAKMRARRRGDGCRHPRVESHGRAWRPKAILRKAGGEFCAVGDWRCRPRGLGAAQPRGRASRQTGDAGCAKALLLDWSERRPREGFVREMGHGRRSACSSRARACRWRRWLRMATLISVSSSSASSSANRALRSLVRSRRTFRP